MRIKLVVAYDGTAYSGWQIQKNAVTVEGELERALSSLFKMPVDVEGCSRTDAGVHAMGNIAVFDICSTIPAEKIAFAVNTLLPEDIRVVSSCEVSEDYNPRFIKHIKTYEYRFSVGHILNPLTRLYSHQIINMPDIDKMNEACKFIVGEHDFKSFCAAGAQVETTVREVTAASVSANGNEVIMRVSGYGFLYNMVRIMAGTLLMVGEGKLEPAEIKKILEARDRTKAGPTLPAKGLTLIGYEQ